MAELNIFRYYPQDSSLHRMDGRIKLICMILFSVAIGLTTSPMYLGIFTILLIATARVSRLPLVKVLSEMRRFLLLITIIITVHGVSIPGTIWLVPGLTREGLSSGILFSWRLLLIILISIILTGTTSLSRLQHGIQWLLRPLPWVREARIATLFNLTFLLIPLIFEQAAQMREAQQARCLTGRRNPVKRILFLTYPLLLQTLLRTDEIVFAMESRCYSEIRTPVIFKTSSRDWLLLGISVLISATVFIVR